MNMYAKFQLHPPYGFWGEDFWIFFRKFTLYVAMATNQIHDLDKIHIVEEYSRNISVKKKSKYLQWDSKNCQFPLFPLWVNGNYKFP